MVGEILDGTYRIDRQLGAGGMGNVYLATHLGTTRVVAVKVIAPRWAAEQHFIARFQREAQACGRLRHPNIVNVTDFGIATTRDGDVPYLVMELLDGETLSAFLKSHPRPPLPLVADLLDQIGLALGEAHGHGIVHRDLKPDNIWLEPNGRGGYTVKVLDFGVAKLNIPGAAAIPPPSPGLEAGHGDGPEFTETALMTAPVQAEQIETVALTAVATTPSSGAFGSSDGGQTMPGSLIGTPAFMSPEQALGKEVDFRSDIYSLAVIAYSFVCGRLPFTGSARDLVRFHQHGNPTPPAAVAKIPGDVSDVILAGMAVAPEDRPESATAFTRRFHNAVDAEFLAFRRSKAFLLQHLGMYALLMLLLHSVVVAASALLVSFAKIIPTAFARMVFLSVVGAALFAFFDNVLRAAAALMAAEEQQGTRRFVSMRVIGRLVKSLPMLLRTQLRAWTLPGPGWVIGDCLWPVLCAVEGLCGDRAVRRSRELMTGLRSAGRAVAIRHLVLPLLALTNVVQSVLSLGRSGSADKADIVVLALWFPLLAVYAAAPLFLYDRTAARASGPLLQLDRTPEVPVTARPLSIASTIWVLACLIYVLYAPLSALLFGRR